MLHEPHCVVWELISFSSTFSVIHCVPKLRGIYSINEECDFNFLSYKILIKKPCWKKVINYYAIKKLCSNDKKYFSRYR
jgi:hypothetical protein